MPRLPLCVGPVPCLTSGPRTLFAEDTRSDEHAGYTILVGGFPTATVQNTTIPVPADRSRQRLMLPPVICTKATQRRTS